MNYNKSIVYFIGYYPVIAALIWIAATLFDFFIYMQGSGMGQESYRFLDILILKIPKMLVFHRILYVLLGMFLCSIIFQLKIVKQLRISEQKLKKANAIKDKLFMIISHDIKSPFTGFLLLSELLMDRNKEFSQDEIYEIGKDINFASKKLYEFMDNLLFWSKSQIDNMSLKPISFNLHSLIDDLFDIYMPIAISKEIKLFNIVDYHLYVKTDKNAVNTILRNLISNSLKFTNPGDVINVKAVKIDDEIIEVSVIDTGIGMDSKKISKIFLMEKKIPVKGTNGEQGTGLGLALVKDIAESINSRLFVISNPGKGTTISFTLPLSTN